MEKIFGVENKVFHRGRRTFYHDNLLPSLPLPSIHQTIKKYLDSCKALLTKEEYKNTENECKIFLDEVSLGIQMPLIQKALKERNWLEDWWSDNAYLKLRQPIMYYYFAGPGPYLQNGWPLIENSQLERSAIVLHGLMQFWKALKTEIFPQHKMSNDEFLTMNQFRYMFNTIRIPHHEKDEIHCSFKTECEGESPTHIIVFYHDRMYKINGIDRRTGRILTPPEFLKILEDIKVNAGSHHGESIAALTCLERDTWAEARQYMISLSDRNKQNLQDISDALVCFCLDDNNPKTYQDMYKIGMTGNCGNKWSDKSFNYSCTENGGFFSTCDHSPFEAMVLIVFTEYNIKLYKHIEKEFPKPWNTDVTFDKAEELIFTLDSKLRDYMRKGSTEYNKFASNLALEFEKFDHFGKQALTNLKVHPDTFVQICIQLTYMRIHGKPASTYETATTRQFYHGRTETCRTCTTEVVAFCNAMIKGSGKLIPLFREAHDKLIALMNECKKGNGCDRHLMGIALQAIEEDEPVPAIFTDPGYAKSGGGGNFTLSTSFTGYSGGTGGVAPMVEDGYGVFYCMESDAMYMSTSSWNSSKVTDGDNFMKEFHHALADVYNVLKTDSSKL